MTKIILLLDAWEPVVGGGQKLFLELATRLIKNHNCSIQVITRSLKDEQGKKFNKNENLLNGKLKIIRLGIATQWQNLFSRILFIFQATIYALKQDCDLYLASTFLPAFSLKLIRLFKSTPNCLVVIGFGAVNKFYIWLEKFITQTLKFDLLITDDYNFYQQVNNKRNIQFIPNGVSLPRRVKAGLPRQIRIKKWPDFTFLFVARNEPRKGADILFKAFDQIKKKSPNIKLRVFGPGFKKISQSQLHQEFFKAHCLVLPSLREGHPLVLFESWAHQLPVIATKVGSVPQFVNKNNGYLINANNIPQLVKAMKLAISNKNLNELGRNGYNLVSKNYSWDKTIKSYYQAFKVCP